MIMPLSTIHQGKKQGGFTLIELLVSLSLFAIAMLMATGATLIVLDANAKSQAASSVMTNINIVLDSISRDMRTGSSFDCSACDDTKPAISLVNQYGADVTYTFDSTLNSGNGAITKQTDGGPAVPITAPEIKIKKMSFVPTGFSSGDMFQPSVLIVVNGEAGKRDKAKTTFDIQTTVTQRAID